MKFISSRRTTREEIAREKIHRIIGRALVQVENGNHHEAERLMRSCVENIHLDVPNIEFLFGTLDRKLVNSISRKGYRYIKFLLDYGAKDGAALTKAVSHGRYDLIKLLHEYNLEETPTEYNPEKYVDESRSYEPMSESRGYIYLLKLQEAIRCGDNVYTIGRTNDAFRRKREYPRKSIIISTFYVNDMFRVEESLKRRLEKSMKKSTYYGDESFEGNLPEILSIMYDICKMNIIS